MSSAPNRSTSSRYSDLTHDELVRLLAARDRRDATRFGLVWEANEIERDKAINSDFVALDLIPELSVAGGGECAIWSLKGTTSTPCVTCA